MLLHASAESYSTPLQYQLLGKYSASCCDKTKPLKIHNYEDSINNKKKKKKTLHCLSIPPDHPAACVTMLTLPCFLTSLKNFCFLTI